MAMTGAFPERKLTIPAELSRLHEVREFVGDAASEFGFPVQERYHLQLAATEAVTNAVQHGSESEEDEIEVRAREEDAALAFYVSDSGRFIPRIRLPDDLPERGRGLAFMTELMDEVEVRPTEDGTVIRFAKRPAA
jgi:anti-sigma regulatory factor (Ser/Thr protein kinase)